MHDHAQDSEPRSRGQVIVMFAGAMILFVLLSAAVIDLSWFWTNNLRIQRAADAAALAGVVFLPGDETAAAAAARVEATKNGYTQGANGTAVVFARADDDNPRRLKVTITADVPTFFARAVGIRTWRATRDAKADFVLPVPMGSPENYYGVGFYEGRVADDEAVPDNTDWRSPDASVSGGQWSNPDRAFTNNDSYATEDSDGHIQQWNDFDLLDGNGIPDDGTLVIDGIRVRLQDARLTGTGTSTDCRLEVGLSWNNGASWTDWVRSDRLTGSDTDPVVGDIGDLSMWTPHTSWTRGQFDTGQFRVRVRWVDGTADCASTQSVRLDQLEVNVQYHTVVTTWVDEVLSVNDPLTNATLASQGFWGAIFTSGGWRENGDRYAPSRIGNGTGATATNASPTYDAEGYDYTVELPGGSGQVRLFDPMFCATGYNDHGGSYGAGDHWTSPTGNDFATNFSGGPVAITYRLYDTNGTPANDADDGDPVATLTYDPGTRTMGDFSGRFGTPQNSTDPDRQDCSSDPAHNAWVTLASGLASATYRLNVNTSLDNDNLNTGAENLFSLWVASGGNARVHGMGRMAAYTNLEGGLQAFYFAQIERVHAGKTMVIELFDPGEVSGNGYLRIQSPDGNAYDYANFNWRSDDGRSGTNVSQIQTAVNGAAQFNNRTVTIEVPLPVSYGAAGLDPPGDATTEDGWWRIEYNVSGGNDTTTWQVSIRGNPVHLVLP